MIPVIIISILSIVMMIALILKFPTLRIKGFQTDTFYLPILLGALILLIFPLFDKTELVNVLFSNSSLNPLKILILFICVSLMSISLDEAGFEKAAKEHKEKAKGSWKKTNYMGAASTVYEDLDAAWGSEFIGYDTLSSDEDIKALCLLHPKGDEEDSVAEALSEVGVAEKAPKLEGRSMMLIISPKNQ